MHVGPPGYEGACTAGRSQPERRRRSSPPARGPSRRELSCWGRTCCPRSLPSGANCGPTSSAPPTPPWPGRSLCKRSTRSRRPRSCPRPGCRAIASVAVVFPK